MERLDQIKMVANNLKTSSKKAVTALHRFIFEQEGDRGNRKRLREFSGLPFAKDSDEYKAKIAYVEANLSWADLVAVCNILAIEYSGTKRELSQRLCNSLIDLNSLNETNEAREEENEEENVTRGESSNEEEDTTRAKQLMSSKDARRRRKIYKKKDEEETDTQDEESNEEDARRRRRIGNNKDVRR